MKIAGIRNNSGINIRFGQNKNSVLKRVIPSAKTAVLCSSLLYPAVLNVTEIKPEDCSNIPITVSEVNNFEKEKSAYVEQEKFSWDKIPDYQKLTGLFYTSLALMLLINIMTYKDKDKNSDDID